MKIEDKMKKWKKRLIIITLLVTVSAILGGVIYWQVQERTAKIAQEEVDAKRKIVIVLDFSQYGQKGNLQYEDGFLKDENLPTFLVRFKEYMDENYPNIGYGTKYQEITMDRLKSEYIEIAEEIRAMESALGGEDRSFLRVVGRVKLEMSYDGIKVGHGAEKVDENSEIALMRKAKARCMGLLGVAKHSRDYIFRGYKEEAFEAFLEDERLPIFLEEMQIYMDEHYPEIGYGTKYEEVTVERLEMSYETVYKELEEIKGKVESTGIGWGDIRRKILEDAGIEEEY